MSYIREELSWYNGYKYVVIFGDMGHRCGYVAIGPEHPLFGFDYNDDIKSPELLQEIKASTLGKRSIINAFCWDGESSTPSMLINVHGGLTYSNLGTHKTYPTNQFDEAWWFGFDCGHYGDAKDKRLLQKYFPERYSTLLEFDFLFGGGTIRSQSYVASECRSMIDQLICIADTLKEIPIVKE